MQKVFSIFLLCVVLVSSCGVAFAAQYPYTTTAINPSWTSVTNAIMIDRNDDGIIDTVYSADTTASSTITFTKIFGTGTTPITKTFSNTLSSNIQAYFGVYNKDFFIVSFSGRTPTPTACVTTINLVSLTTGAVQVVNSVSQVNNLGGANADCYLPVPQLMQRTDNKLVNWSWTSHNAVTTYTLWANSTSITGAAGSGTPIITPYGVDISANTNIYRPNTGTTTGVLNGAGHVYNNTLNSNIAQMNTTAVFYNLDYNATLWTNGLKRIAQTSLYQINAPTWSTILGSYIPTTIPSNETALYLNYKILKSDLTSEPQRFLIKNGSTLYIGLLSGTTLYYTTIPNLTGYAFQSFLLDTYMPTIGSLAASSNTPTPSIKVVTPSTSYSISSLGIQGFISGYSLDVINVDRSYKPAVSDSLVVMPVSIPPTTGLTATTVNVKNAPTDAIVKITNPLASLLGQSYVWSTKELTADGAFAIDLPSAVCFNVEIAQGDVITKLWTSLGQLCASGTMPKTITYTTNLAFTFWSLTWGTSHLFDQSTQNLQTMVRHKTQPFSYYVNIQDKNSTVVSSNFYTSNSTGIDLHVINTTAIEKPARLEILDDTNHTLYFATLGYPSYLSGISAWFIEWLSHDGFSLIAMLPIIFSAMFTRNTVGIGTCLTVAFIATMVWLGLLAIPDIVLYALMFIAAIGVVAYKTLF